MDVTDIIFRKSVIITDTVSNGGRKGQARVISGARNNLFPRVTKSERTAGLTRWRKEFLSNENAANEAADLTIVWIEVPSNGDDRFYLLEGTQRDTQGDVSAEGLLMGCGTLDTALVGGESAIDLQMSSDDYVFAPAGTLHLANKKRAGQTMESDVVVGDFVFWNSASWEKAASTDIVYPNGLCIDVNTVLTEQSGSFTEEFLTIKNTNVAGEIIGVGDDTTTPSLSPLAAITNEVYPYSAIIVTAICGAVSRTVNISATGVCSGYCSAGQLNMADGTWTTPITFTTSVDLAEDILIDYADAPYSYVGNLVTVELEGTVANPYLTAETFGSASLVFTDLEPSLTDWVENSVAGTYDETTYPLALNNLGTEEDDIVITFTSPSNFSVSGTYLGDLGTGNITTDFAPINPNTGVAYFTLDKDGWGGTWSEVSPDTVSFSLHPAALPIWWKEVVPAATPAEPRNLTVQGWYME